jgi:hypothetical protein
MALTQIHLTTLHIHPLKGAVIRHRELSGSIMMALSTIGHGKAYKKGEEK